MNPLQVVINQEFIDRENELSYLLPLIVSEHANILIVYGRRRVGKTELIEQTYRERNLLKFEGLEGKPQTEQIKHVLRQLARYTGDPMITKLQLDTWTDVFELIYKYVSNGVWTLYFEETQWIADYQDDFISEFKYAWDNFFRHNPKLLVIVCGSSPSFMIKHVVQSKALYNRSQHELQLEPFHLSEVEAFFKHRSRKEIMDAYLILGGIPEYLKRVNNESSLFIGICKNSFTKNAYFANEYKRIFISSMVDNSHYQAIIEFLSTHRFATRNEIMQHLKIKSGGSLSTILEDLILCGFIQKYVPYNLNDTSMLARYCIKDAYLQFYFKFIAPCTDKIAQGQYQGNPTTAIKTDTYYKWLGFAFERYCRDNHYLIAKCLSFAAVNYRSGAFYNRATQQSEPNYQIDLLFDRDDHVITICEIKYTKSPIGIAIVSEFEKKLSFFPNPKNKTIHKVLITKEGVDANLKNQAYFDQILSLDDLFDA